MLIATVPALSSRRLFLDTLSINAKPALSRVRHREAFSATTAHLRTDIVNAHLPANGSQVVLSPSDNLLLIEDEPWSLAFSRVRYLARIFPDRVDK